MSLPIPDELEREMREVQSVLAQALSDLERLRARKIMLQAQLNHHKHDWARDIANPPTTYAPAAHTHAAYADIGHNHNASYSTTGHTHAYASNTHVHNYSDSKSNNQSSTDEPRTTGGPI